MSIDMSLHEQIKEYYPQYSDIQHYPADKCACIRKTSAEWGIFGNFYHAPIVINGVTIDCTERLFHLMKFKATAVEGIRSEYAAKRGMNIKTHMKPMYRLHPEWFREDWGSMVVDVMRFCLQTKYEQCEAFRKELERSKGLFIVEDETARNARRHKDADSWGTNLVGNEYVGPSLLGRLLMELRDNGKLEYNLPDDAFTFLQYLK
jgi:predicted NAD-dependent protein-ADP-ribosyltransferase YbiA (DUF1768 family)